ncbi:MAG: deoxynucleoside kinase [bacterium]
MKYRHIAIEGPIGAGKTSLARMLAREFNARLVLESVEENPFLEKFYQKREEYAFQTQLYFLLSRYKKQTEFAQPDLFQQIVVSDYMLDKDRIFASVNLSDDELALYEQIYRILDLRVTRPDMVLLLQASPKTLLERIRKRGKPYEKNIEIDYLEDLCRAYTSYFFSYNKSPLLIINTDNLDFIENKKDMVELLKELRRFQGGTQFWNPMEPG